MVVGFDNSEPSRRALIWGADLLRARPGILHVVYADHVLIGSDLSGFAHSEMEDARDEKAAGVAEAAAEIAAAAGVPYTFERRPGSPADAILSAASIQDAAESASTPVALEDEFARAAAGEFRVVLLLGEAGVGKSRLGRELLVRHPEAAGMFGRAHPLGVTAAFGLWAEAIDPLLQGRSDRQIAAVCGGLLDDLASLFHRVAVVRGSLPDREPPLPRLLQGLAALVRNLAAEAPVLAVLDDVHFADASSWEALRYFARHLDATRLLVVATSLPRTWQNTRSRPGRSSSWTRTGSCADSG